MKTFCSQLILDTNKATTNLNNNNSLMEWTIDFKTLLLDDFEIGALYNINHTAVVQENAGATAALTGFFSLKCNAMTFLNNCDLIDSNGKYVLSDKAIFPYITLGSTHPNAEFESWGYSQTFQLSSYNGTIKIQHYLKANNYVINNTTLNDTHLLSFDIYKIN